MISPLAQIDPATKIGKDVRIDAFAVVDKNVVIGDGCHIMSGAVVLSHVILGKTVPFSRTRQSEAFHRISSTGGKIRPLRSEIIPP